MDGKIQIHKKQVRDLEEVANGAREKLKQLESTIKEEGLFVLHGVVLCQSVLCTVKYILITLFSKTTGIG